MSGGCSLGGEPSVAIVLVTYYGSENLARLFASLAALDYPDDRWSLIVVDNDPQRRAERWFASEAPHVRVLVPGANTGYAGGVALGMDQAMAVGAEYVAVITQDTAVESRWLRELVDVARQYPGAGAVQPKILRRDHDGRLVINTWGNELTFLGVGYAGGDGKPDRPLPVRSIPYASGAGVLYRTTALKEVGGLDPAYFMYHEDTDLSWRMRLAGWDVMLAPDAVMEHDYRFRPSADKFYYLERNRLTNLLTHYRLRTLLLAAPALALFEAVVLLHALSSGWFRRRLAVYGFFLRASTWRYVREKRRRVQSLRRVPDRDIVSHFTGLVEAPALDGVGLRVFFNPFFNAVSKLLCRGIRW